ncbi:hypothetical protein ACVWZA_003925 [Sphingomonas sp. UYAg733]
MDDDSYRTVAITYNQPETAVMLSMFSFYDIPAYAVGQGHASAMPTWMVALGGIQIRVHSDALDEAFELLAEVAERPRAVRRRLIDDPVVNGILVVLFCVLLFMPVPPTRTGSTFFIPRRD